MHPIAILSVTTLLGLSALPAHATPESPAAHGRAEQVDLDVPQGTTTEEEVDLGAMEAESTPERTRSPWMLSLPMMAVALVAWNSKGRKS